MKILHHPIYYIKRNKNVDKNIQMQYNKKVHGDVMVSTLHQKNRQQVVDSRWPLKKRENKINADKQELAYAA